MTGWEKVANPAERAVAVMQAQGNSIYPHHFENRWGVEAKWQLIEAGVMHYSVLFGLVELLRLAPEFCAPDPWLERLEERRRQAEGANA